MHKAQNHSYNHCMFQPDMELVQLQMITKREVARSLQIIYDSHIIYDNHIIHDSQWKSRVRPDLTVGFTHPKLWSKEP